MSFKAVLSVISGLVFILAFFPYIKAIVRMEASPRKATWLVWAAGDIIVIAGMIAKHTINGQMVAAVLGATAVFLLSVKFGQPGWIKPDKICITLSAFAIALWLYLGDSNIGIGFSLLSLAIAAWPTYVSAWENPRKEDKKAWILFNVSSLLAVLAIPSASFADAAPPIVFLAIDGPMLYLVLVRPAFLARRTRSM